MSWISLDPRLSPCKYRLQSLCGKGPVLVQSIVRVWVQTIYSALSKPALELELEPASQCLTGGSRCPNAQAGWANSNLDLPSPILVLSGRLHNLWHYHYLTQHRIASLDMRLTLLYASLVPLGAVVQQVPRAESELPAVYATSLPRDISPRQSTLLDSVPSAWPQCSSACAPIVKVLDSTTCTTTSCLCTSTNARSLETCANCIVREVPNTLSAAKIVLADFKSACSGVTLPSLSITASGSTATRTTTTGTRTTTTRTSTTRTTTNNPFPTKIYGNDNMFVSTSAAVAGAASSLVLLGATTVLAVGLAFL
ncbi:hypothetical protein BD779DRAFT_1740201 [Infundibulicybe gibba]|nr:hypothetical protein BD779DRAFT_1740201 [Infundibulicybe gibba]